MSTVLNLIKIIFIVSGWGIYFLGLGYLLIFFLYKRKKVSKATSANFFFEIIPISLISGMIINYGIVLLIQSLKVSIILGGLLALVGLIIFFLSISKKQIHWKKPSIKNLNWLLICFLIGLLYLGIILFIPVQEWDARSIWFFHAKMIYYARTIGLASGWQDPTVGFSHVDYPMLVPVMAAQIAYLNGFWNEYLPKISLFFLLLPALLWLFSFARASISFLFLIFALLFSMEYLLWNGYMDGYLAVFFAISLLLFYRFQQLHTLSDLNGAVLSLIFVTYIKNEGQLAFIVGMLSLVLFCFWNFRKKTLNTVIITFLRKKAVLFLILLLPFFAWLIYKQIWGLQNDLHIASTQSLLRIYERLGNGSLTIILEKCRQNIYISLIVVSCLLFAQWFINGLSFRKFLLFITPAVIYLGGIITVYMLSPQDIIWHLDTSIDRTMLPVSVCLWVMGYVILTEFEAGNNKVRYINLPQDKMS